MPAKVIIWSPAKAKDELHKRLDTAIEYRAGLEVCWDRAEQAVYNTGGPSSVAGNLRYSFESDVELGMDAPDNSASDIGVNLTFQHWRFITAQMSANPPTVIARPTSSDYTDKRKADAADRLVRHAIRDKKLQEIIDLTSAKAVLYGTAYIKTVWNPDAGDICDIIDAKKMEYELEGEIEITSPSVRCIYLDPDARVWSETKWTFEAHIMTAEEAEFKWPEYWDQIKAQMDTVEGQLSSMQSLRGQKNDSLIKKVTVYEYYERGMPLNGMVGRHGYCLRDGSVLGELGPNPFAFAPPRKSEDEVMMPPTAHLPYHILTDIDVPDQVYGKSFIEYEALIQDTLNRLDSAQLDNVQAHGVTRMVLPEGAEVAKGSFTNSPWDIVEITGSQPPFFMTPPPGLPDVTALRDRLEKGAGGVAGINDSMSGNTSRETSGFSMQYAVNQGNMVRRRLFNKYVMCVESVFKAYLNLVRKYWDEPHTIMVLGKEKAFESAEIKGADIEGGFDIVVEYGASLSLDPGTRREEIMQMYPLLKEAGMEPRKILSLIKLSELEQGYDLMEQAAERQYEDFQKMIATDIYVAPEEMQEHKGRLAFGYEFLETVEFKYLPDETKALLRQHIKDREAMAAQTQQAGNPATIGTPTPDLANAQPGPPQGVPTAPVNVAGGPKAPAPKVPAPTPGPMAPVAAPGGGSPGLS